MRLIIFCLSIFSLPVFAGDVPAIEPSQPIKLSQNVNDDRKTLNEKEKKAGELARQWIEAKSMPVRKEDGKIVYLYGSTLPTVICAPLSVCDIELQAGEKITGVPMLGDAARWEAKPALSGAGSSQISHIIIKPFESGLTTTVIITTSKRTYHIKLVSSNKNWTPRVAFTYPDDIERQWALYNAQASEESEKKTMPETRENIDALNFEYELSGKAAWKPVRVYNDGIKTYIQMPSAMGQTEAPALLVIGSDGEQQIVNYRLKNDRFIVDQIFAKAILIAGVGSAQEKIVISFKDSTEFKT
ncbi:MAG: P-type conjugative transfer protein TrbG, partial [Proteobacteria bacterium]